MMELDYSPVLSALKGSVLLFVKSPVVWGVFLTLGALKIWGKIKKGFRRG